MKNGKQLYMGNSVTSAIEGKGTTVLKMTSGKEFTLNNMLYVQDICKNLISGPLLSKNGFRLVFESNKFVLTKSGMYVGKGYLSDWLCKMNVMTVVPHVVMNENNTSSAYIVESSYIWHDRLWHVNYDSLKKLVNLNYLPKFEFDPNHKCEVCVEAKMTKKYFQNILRNSEPLNLIHNDICDFKFIQTRADKKYFITFIDDSTKYCHMYLLRSKDEVLDAFKVYKNEVEN